MNIIFAEDEDEGDEEAEEEYNPPEVGPPILSPISMDKSLEYTLPWIATQTSKFTNKKERIEVLRSNVWPGAYTFIFETTCESIYMGWGHKYVHRNMPFKHLNNVVEEYPHGPLDFVEAIDPTPEMEEAYRLSLIKKEKPVDIVGEEMSALDDDDDDDEGDTSEYDEF